MSPGTDFLANEMYRKHFYCSRATPGPTGGAYSFPLPLNCIKKYEAKKRKKEKTVREIEGNVMGKKREKVGKSLAKGSVI